MATEKLYYQDAHQAQFQATVLSCRPGKHGYDVVLDRTCFYPEGGGQPGDTGVLSGVRVTDTHEAGGEIVHYCEAPLAEGQTVEGTIDYERRFEFMQLHTGEHILSGVIHRRFGYENVGFHMGADFVTIDLSGMLTPEQVQSVEAEANEWIWKNVPVEVSYPDPEALKTIPYRSKKELTGQVRIVTIPGADICACCGTHVSNTGEIGLLRIFSCVRFHDGVRLELLCGRRALRYLRALTEQNRQVSGLLSAKPLETAGAVQRLLDAEGALKLRAASLEDAVFTQKAQALAETESLPAGELVLRLGETEGVSLMSVAFEFGGRLTQPEGQVRITLPAAAVEGRTLMLLDETGGETEVPVEIRDEEAAFLLDFTPQEGEEPSPVRLIRLIPNP